MAQSTTSSGSAPSTLSDSENPSLPRAKFDVASCLPKGPSKSSTLQFEPPRFSQRSVSDPLPSTPSQRFSDSHKSSSGAATIAADEKRRSQHLAISAPTGEGVERGSIAKRHSYHSHTNVHTECGRHGDGWLCGGFSVVETVKRMFKKK
jgi:hypothetical protein